jgi:hypothetical protein
MALTITATWLPDVHGYKLTATGGTGVPTWYRSCYWPDGRFRNAGIGTGLPAYDTNVPIDGPTVVYTAIDGALTGEKTVKPPTHALPVLGLFDRTDMPAAEVVVESFREQSVTARTVYYDILDRNEPFIQTMRPAARTGSMTLHVAHPGGAFPNPTIDRLRKMLRTGERMTLRTTCNDRVEDLLFIFERWTEMQVGSGNHHGPDRKIEIEWRAVDAMWDTLAVAGRVWAMVPGEFATWTDVVAQVPTWDDLVAGL